MRENSYDKLTDAEKTYLQEQARLNCIAESNANFGNFQSYSDDQFNSSSTKKFYRNRNWKYVLKKNSVVMQTMYFNVWKTDTNIVYFIIKNVDATESITYKFLKVTSTTNDEMISDLQVKKCAGYFSSVNDSSTALTVEYTPPTTRDDASTRTYTTKSLTGSYLELALFIRFNESSTIKKIDNAGATIGTPDTLSGSVSLEVDVAPEFSVYSDYPAATTSYCVIDFNAGAPNTYDFLTLSDSTYLECTTNPAVGPTGFGVPSTELAI